MYPSWNQTIWFWFMSYRGCILPETRHSDHVLYRMNPSWNHTESNQSRFFNLTNLSKQANQRTCTFINHSCKNQIKSIRISISQKPQRSIISIDLHRGASSYQNLKIKSLGILSNQYQHQNEIILWINALSHLASKRGKMYTP